MTIDIDNLLRVLLDLLRTPSPSGFTDGAVSYVERELDSLGVPYSRTPKGALVWTLEGGDAAARAVASHIDTLGAMVKEIKSDGRVKLTSIGGYDWATIEGEYCLVHPQDGEPTSGTIVNTKQSVHVHGSEGRELKRTADTIEVRLDAVVRSADDVRALGIEVGDFVTFDTRAVLTGSGHVKGRHLDNKAAVAISLEATRALRESGTSLPGDVHFFVSNYEEVGHGAAAGIPDGITELLCIDMAAIGEGQAGSEHHVTLCVKDGSGPYDPRMNRALRRLAGRNGIDLKTDIYTYYASDASAAWAAGGSYRAALVGPGVDASHAYERTHRDALEATTRLLLAWCVDNSE